MDALVQTELDLIGAVYDAVIDTTLWDNTIDRIRRHFGFQIAAMGSLHRSGMTLHTMGVDNRSDLARVARDMSLGSH